MPHETFPTALQDMIDRAGTLTAYETESLGSLWENGEELVLPAPRLGNELVGIEDYPIVTNAELNAAWERALHVAGEANRVDVIDAARAAGRSAKHDERHVHGESEGSKNAAEEAVRSAVLAVGVRDLLPKEDLEALAGPWQKVLGGI